MIVVQPESQILPAGYAYTLRGVAIGERPLFYQWSRDGSSLSDATNSILLYSSLTTNHNGSYVLVASNSLGTATSLPGLITVTNAMGGGFLKVSNNASIKDVDGVTALSGTNYMAQIYAGPSPDLLRPLGSPTPFRTGNLAGFIVVPSHTLPDVVAGAPVHAQMRAWDATRGRCYEEARAAGGKFGFSQVRPYTAAGSPGIIHLMPTFNLKTGLPFFYTGHLSVGPPLPDGTPQFVLTGQVGFRYLIESQQTPNNWLPLHVVTNTTGSVFFTDPSPGNVHIYRARILD